MNTLQTHTVFTALLAAWTIALPTAHGQDTFLQQERRAIDEAVAGVAEAVVRIELVGVAETTGEVRSDAPSVGTVVDPDGWIIASSLVTEQPAASILVVLADGSRQTARVVARDTSRELVLLKTETDSPMAAVSLPEKVSPVVGHYAIAVGRVAGSDHPAVSVGIISATGRLNGRAVQTDARVSPIHYGGPLLDIRGRILGILVPAMPEAAGAEEKAGWYDAGIAFAIPADRIATQLPQMQSGQDIYRGLLGTVARAADSFAAGTTIDAVRPRSPAEKAGLQPGDEILRIGDRDVRYHYQVREALGSYNAGDQVAITVRREEQTLQLSATLAKEIPSLQPQMIGLYAAADETVVRVTAVEPESPAAQAELAAGDILLAVNDHAVASLDSLRRRILTSDPEAQLRLRYRRGEDERTASVENRPIDGPLAPLPPAPDRDEASDDEASDDEAGDDGDEAFWEPKPLTLPDVPNKAFYFAPRDPQASAARALLLVLLDPGTAKPEAVLSEFAPLAQRLGVAVAVIAAADERRWTPAEADIVGRVATQLGQRLGIDRWSIGVTGWKQGPSHAMALVVGLTENAAVGGAAVRTDIRPPAIRLRENDPEQPLQLAMPLAADGELPGWAGVLPKLGFPVVRTGDLQIQTLLQWTGTLPRL